MEVTLIDKAGAEGSDLKLVEQNHRESERPPERPGFQLVSENLPYGLVMIGQDGTFQYVNPKFKELFGYDLNDVPDGKAWFRKAYPDPDYRHKVISVWKADLEHFKPGEKVPRAFKATCKDGMEKIVKFITVQVETGEYLMACEDITEHKRREEELRSSEERYRALAESAQDFIFIVGRDGQIRYVNRFGADQFGARQENIIGKNIEDLFPPEVSKRQQQSIRKVFESGESLNLENRTQFPHQDLWLDTKLIPLKDDSGDVSAVLGTSRDITRSKHAEEALRKSEETARRMAQENAIVAEIGRIISSTLDIDEVYERFAQESRKIIPFDRICINVINPDSRTTTIAYVAGVEEPGRRVGDCVPLEGTGTQACIEERSGMFIQTEKMEELAVRFPGLLPSFQAGLRSIIFVPLTSKDQIIGILSLRSKKPNAYSSQDLRVAESIGAQIAGAIANAHLFANLKNAEKALRKSEERFRELYDNAPVGYHEYNTEGRITNVNQTDLEMLGYKAEEMIGKPMWKFSVQEDVAREVIQKKLAGKLPPGRGIERTYRRKDGRLLPVLIEDRLILDEMGRISGIRCIIQDITERKQAEREMLALQDQLRQAMKMEAVGRLAGGIAHDFNNLLTIISGYSQLSLRTLEEGNPLRENLGEIQKGTERAAALTRQLLAFSRRQIMEMRVLELNAILRDLEKLLRRIIGEDIELITILSETLGRIKADPGQVEQVIVNLAVNARDAMPAGGKFILETSNVDLDENDVRSHIGIKPGAYIEISVSDTGAGMSSEVRERIFEPFFTTKEVGKGTGLGLSTVYGIVKQSGGDISVHSEVGRGTTFRVYFPRVDEASDTWKAKPCSTPSRIFPGSETILLVEDEEAVRTLARKTLGSCGYSVLEASNGQEALRVAEGHCGSTIHLLLTDVVMPGMAGRDLADHLIRSRPELKVLYMSGYTDDAIVHHGILDPGIHLLLKPFPPQTLVQKVQEILRDAKEPLQIEKLTLQI